MLLGPLYLLQAAVCTLLPAALLPAWTSPLCFSSAKPIPVLERGLTCSGTCPLPLLPGFVCGGRCRRWSLSSRETEFSYHPLIGMGPAGRC